MAANRQADGTIYVNTAIEDDGFVKGSKRIETAFRNAAKTLNGISETQRLAFQKMIDTFASANNQFSLQSKKVSELKRKLAEMQRQGKAVPVEKYQELENEFSKLEKQITDLTAKMEKFRNSGGNVDGSEYKNMEAELNKLGETQDQVTQKMKQMEASGTAFQSDSANSLSKKIYEEAEKLRIFGNKLGTSYESVREKLKQAGATFPETTGVTDALDKEEQRATSKISQMKQKIWGAYENMIRQIGKVSGYKGMPESATDTSGALDKEGRSAGQASSEMDKLARNKKKAKNENTGLGNSARKSSGALDSEKKKTGLLSGVMGKFGSRLKNVTASLLRNTIVGRTFGKLFPSMTKNISGSSGAMSLLGNLSTKTFKKGFWNVMKYAFGIKSMFILVKRLKGAFTDGMNNLVKYSSSANKAMSQLKSSMTQLKNSFATAFAPIIEVVAPYLSTFINMISKALTYVGMFFAALTGKKTVSVAKKVNQDYAASLGDTADAAKDAADATKEADKANNDYLSGLDEINRYTEEDKSSSSGGSGGGGGGASGLSPSDMFETVKIPSMFENISAKMKDAWNKADFTEIGTIVGTKMRDALNNIPWDNIKAGAEKIAKVTGTFINGYFETPGLFKSIGNTVAQGLNTALTFAKTFLDTTHFDSIGKAVTTGISSFFRNVDWSLLGGTISSAFSAFFDYITGLFNGIDWANLPMAIVTGIRDFFTGFDWKNLFGSLATMLFTILKASFNLNKAIGDLIVEAFSNIGAYFKQYIDEAKEQGGNWALGILYGIRDIFLNIGKWIKENILEPFIDAFKNVFGIHSPAKNKKIVELGKNIMLGVLNGVLDGIKNIGSWVKNKILTPILNAFTNVGSFFSEAGSTIWNGIQSAFGAVKKTLTATVTAVKTKVFDTIKEKWDSIKDKFSTSTIGGVVKDTFTKLKDKWDSIKSHIQTKTIQGKDTKSFDNVWDWWHDITDKKVTLTLAAVTVGNAAKGLADLVISAVRKNAEGGIFTNGSWKSIPGYASGGTPKSARLFYANENGIPELVGRIGSNTAVLNNGQIVASVASGVYRAVVAAFSSLQNYFASMSMAMCHIPTAIESLTYSIPSYSNVPMPVMATGTVVPPSISIDRKSINDLKESISGLKDMIGNISINQQTSGTQNNQYTFIGQINRRTLFEEMMTEAELIRSQTGWNPFDLR